jgi:hypothetical protein
VKPNRAGDAQTRGAETAAARARRGKAEFRACFAALQDVIGEACAAGGEWESRVASGVRAALEFVAADPEAALTLTVRARRVTAAAGTREDEVLAHLEAQLDRVTPSHRRFDVGTNRGAVDAIATIVRGNLLAGRAERLPSLAPELVELTLMPYCGLASARRWADPGKAERW